ncbi:MAG: F0F1 ATP synthase subunit gamma, partial [Candidatus Dependentiae bacterium]
EIIHTAEDCAIPTIPEIARTITSLICSAKEPYTSVRVYYTHLQNFFMQSPTKEKIIPLDLNAEQDDASGVKIELPKGHNRYLWEQEPAQISKHIIRHYLYTSIVSVLFDSLISENAARFIAMDQSTNNAEKYLENLSLDYNKSRQSLITREISELASNME